MRMSENFHDNEARERFELDVEGHIAFVTYRKSSGAITLVHTEVPPQLEGRGLASHLVRAAFDHARDNGMDVLPVCSYVRTWAQRHPEVSPLLAE